jgi:hypothetical protein
MEKEIELNKIEWVGKEYEFKERSVDWFWAVGLICLVSVGVSVWFHNFVFAIFLFISGVSIIILNHRKPLEVSFIIESKGITLGKDLYEWNKIKGFNILKQENRNKLLLNTNKNFLPVITITIPKDLTEEIETEIKKVLVFDKEIQETHSTQFAEKIGL